eukprot:1314917-Pyramimonas_sp.AAC.1
MKQRRHWVVSLLFLCACRFRDRLVVDGPRNGHRSLSAAAIAPAARSKVVIHSRSALQILPI